jgi:hypothetical protein
LKLIKIVKQYLSIRCVVKPGAILIVGRRMMEAVMVYYVALSFIHVEGGLAPGEAVECPHGASAVRRAQALASNKDYAGAVAFSRIGDPNLGEFDDAVILKTFGEVPDDFGSAASA